jgi:hypothetical protein
VSCRVNWLRVLLLHDLMLSSVTGSLVKLTFVFVGWFRLRGCGV